jgi:DNA-binding NarL/FixJ family response regulator
MNFDSVKPVSVDSPVSDQVRVFVFESTPMSCEILCHAMEASGNGIKVVGSSVGLGGTEGAKIAEADVVVISLALKDGPRTGLNLLRKLVKIDNSVQHVMLVDEADRDLVVEAFRSGAVGVCERDQSYEMLCKCIRSVYRGQVWANSKQMRYIVEALAGGTLGHITDAQGKRLLTRREEEVCALVAEGLKNREIADSLKLSEHTVKNHLFRIFDRLGISNRAELILYLLVGQTNSAEPESNGGRI